MYVCMYVCMHIYIHTRILHGAYLPPALFSVSPTPCDSLLENSSLATFLPSGVAVCRDQKLRLAARALQHRGAQIHRL